MLLQERKKITMETGFLGMVAASGTGFCLPAPGFPGKVGCQLLVSEEGMPEIRMSVGSLVVGNG